MMPSFRRRKVSSSSHGSPISPRNTADGNFSANSCVKWHSPRASNWSMKWLTRAVTSSSIASIWRGREDRVEDLAVLEVAGRVDAQRDERAHVAELEEPLRREHLGVLERGLDRPAARHHVHAGHGLHDLGLDEVLVDRLRARGVAQALGRVHHRGAVTAFARRRHGVGREGSSCRGCPSGEGTRVQRVSDRRWTKTDAIRHTPNAVRTRGGLVTTYVPSTVELTDDSPEAIADLFEARGLGDGLPVVAPTPARVDAMLEHADRRPRRGARDAAPPRRDRHPEGRRDQRGPRRVPAADVPRGAHRDPRARSSRDEPAGRQRHHPPGRTARARRTARSRRPRGSPAASARSVPATAPTRPSDARCGCCCSTSPAPVRDRATPRRTGSRRSTRSAPPSTSTRRPGRGTR